MKKTLLLLCMVFTTMYANAQFTISIGGGTRVNAFDFSTLSEKTLLIKAYGIDLKFDKEFEKLNKFDKAVTAEEKVRAYTEAWKEGIAISSYDVTKYEFNNYNHKTLFKEKNTKSLLLAFYIDEATNRYAQIWVTGPKKLLIANILINGLNLSRKDDVKLLFNMINYNLFTAAEVDSEGKEKVSAGVKLKYKERFISYVESMSDKTLLIPKFLPDTNARKPEKELKRVEEENDKLIEGLKSWNMSKYEVMTEEQINERRSSGEPGNFYWRNMNQYILIRIPNTNITFPVLGARINMIFTADKDEMIHSFVGGDKNFNEKTVEKLQESLTKTLEKFKKELSK